MSSKLSVRSVVTVRRTAKAVARPDYLTAKSDEDLKVIVRATAASLRALTVAGLEADVRLPKAVVEHSLWTVYKAAKAEQRRRVEFDAIAAREDEQERLDAENEAFSFSVEEQYFA